MNTVNATRITSAVANASSKRVLVFTAPEFMARRAGTRGGGRGTPWIATR